MQANFIIFPHPRQYNLALIANEIVLLPRLKQSSHRYYRHFSLPHTENRDLLKDFLDRKKYNSSKSGISQLHNGWEELSDDQIDRSLEQYPLHRMQESLTIIPTVQSRMTLPLTSNSQLEPAFNISLSAEQVLSYIPCLFLAGRSSNHRLMLYLHANGEDICSSAVFLRQISKETGLSILAMEYRGYSLYSAPTLPELIEEDTVAVMQYLLAQQLKSHQIIIFGRSIGCAISLSLSARFESLCVVLLSPFFSLKKVAGELYGRCASVLLEQTFKNQQNIAKVKSPVLLIHGLKDNIVSHQHSLAIMSRCRSYCRLQLVEHMTHTKFNFHRDIILTLNDFLRDVSPASESDRQCQAADKLL